MRLLRISHIEHKTNEYVRKQVDSLVGKQEPLLATVNRRKLSWFGHIIRHDTIAKICYYAPGGQETTGPPEKKMARQYTRMDSLRPTNPATHSREQTTPAIIYDRPGQGMKVKMKCGQLRRKHQKYPRVNNLYFVLKINRNGGYDIQFTIYTLHCIIQ